MKKKARHLGQIRTGQKRTATMKNIKHNSELNKENVALTMFTGPISNTKPAATKRYSMEGLSELFRVPKNGKKDGPYFVRGVCDGDRCNENMQNAAVIVIDADKGTEGRPCPPVDLVIDALEVFGWEYILYTSYSHTPTEPRYRIILRPSRLLSEEEIAPVYLHILHALAGTGVHIKISDESKTFSQPWFFPRYSTNEQKKNFQYASGGTEPVDIDRIIANQKTTAIIQDEHTGLDIEETIRAIVSGEVFHPKLLALGAHYIATGMAQATAVKHLQAIMQQCKNKDQRWHDRYGQIEKLVSTADAKFAFSGEPEGEMSSPISLDHHMLPDFSADILPSRLAEIVVALEKATETPIELPALLAIATVATACQKKFIVQPEVGYSEPVNTWTLVALDSANRKSAVQKILTAPLLSWERAKHQEMEEIIQEAESRKLNQEARIHALRSKYAKAKAADLGEIESELLKLDKNIVEIPKPPQIWAQDITSEKLGATMAEQGEKLSILSAEGGIFDILGGRYSNGVPNLDIFLQSHSGDSVRVDRGSRAAVFMQHPSLTMGLSPQPGVLTGLTEKPSLRNRGLLARFLYALPVSLLGKRTLKPVPLSPSTEENFNQLICTLLDIEIAKDDNGDPKPYILYLSKQAWKEWKEFSLWVESELADGGKFEHIRDWAGKLPGQATRIAALFHCVEHAGGQPWGLDISENTMGKALSLAAILTEHALAVFDLMGADKDIDAARKVWRWIERNRTNEFSKRECFRALSGTFKKVTGLAPAINILTERNYIRELHQKKGKAGRPSERFEVNPTVIEGWK